MNVMALPVICVSVADSGAEFHGSGAMGEGKGELRQPPEQQIM